MFNNIHFIVLTSSRTGSTWLIDVLNSHPTVRAYGELFLRQPRLAPAIADRTDYRRFIEVYETPVLTRIPKVIRYLNGLYRGPQSVGFKLMYSHLARHPEILVYGAARRLRIVHLVRRNHLDVIVSEQLARVTGTSHMATGTQGALPQVHLDTTKLLQQIASLDRKARLARRLVALSTCPAIELAYEDLVSGPQHLARLRAFLHLAPPAHEVTSGISKRGTRPHSEAIFNFDEVCNALAETAYARLLH